MRHAAILLSLITTLVILAGCAGTAPSQASGNSNQGASSGASATSSTSTTQGDSSEDSSAKENNVIDSLLSAAANSGQSASSGASGKSASASSGSSTNNGTRTLRNNTTCFLVGTISLVKGDENSFPQPRLWAALDFDKPMTYEGADKSETTLERVQIGPVATEGNNQADWEPLVGQRVVLNGTIKGQDWNAWHLTPCNLENATVLGSGEGHRTDNRDKVATEFMKAIRTNYHLENGEYVHENNDHKPYVSPTSELYEWHDGNDEGEGILILGNPCRVKSVDVVDVVGDTYILDVCTCAPVDLNKDPKETEQVTSYAIVFNDQDLVQHAYN